MRLKTSALRMKSKRYIQTLQTKDTAEYEMIGNVTME